VDELTSDHFLSAGISSAEELAALGESLIMGTKVDLLYQDAADFPGATIGLVERWAAIQYVAALVLLERPPVAHAAIVLLRGVVEAYSHAYWISRGTDTGTDSRACRALCFEHGAAREMRDAVTNAAPGVVDDEGRAEAGDRVLRINKLRKVLVCRQCRGRDHGDVLPTIREISKTTGVAWLGDMVRTTRMAAHQLQPDRVLRRADDGVLEVGGPAEVRERAALLQWLALTYSNLLRVVAQIAMPEREREIDAALLPVRIALAGVVAKEGPL
jgi:hypothetical protein